MWVRRYGGIGRRKRQKRNKPSQLAWKRSFLEDEKEEENKKKEGTRTAPEARGRAGMCTAAGREGKRFTSRRARLGGRERRRQRAASGGGMQRRGRHEKRTTKRQTTFALVMIDDDDGRCNFPAAFLVLLLAAACCWGERGEGATQAGCRSEEHVPLFP